MANLIVNNHDGTPAVGAYVRLRVSNYLLGDIERDYVTDATGIAHMAVAGSYTGCNAHVDIEAYHEGREYFHSFDWTVTPLGLWPAEVSVKLVSTKPLDEGTGFWASLKAYQWTMVATALVIGVIGFTWSRIKSH
jgi:hypothetical protein